MAGRMKLRAALVAAAALLVAASAAHGQALRDPTRPPGPGARTATGKAEQSGYNLQSVLISPERRYAIINGEIVPIGGSVGGAELVAVAPERVTLRTRDGLREVPLFPDVVRPGAEGAASSRHAAPSGKNVKIEKSGSTN